MSICTVKSSLTQSPALQDILNVSFIPYDFVKSNLFHFRSISPKSYNPEVLFLNYLQMSHLLFGRPTYCIKVSRSPFHVKSESNSINRHLRLQYLMFIHFNLFSDDIFLHMMWYMSRYTVHGYENMNVDKTWSLSWYYIISLYQGCKTIGNMILFCLFM